MISSPEPFDHDQFGSFVAIADGRLAIGAPVLPLPEARTGANVYVYDARNGELLRTIDAPEICESYGSSIGLYKNILVVGAALDKREKGIVGSAYAYDADSGDLLFEFANPRPEERSGFGADVAVDDEFIAISAPGADEGEVDTGCIYIFSASDGSLVRTIKNPSPGQRDWFGLTLSLDNGILATSSDQDSDGVRSSGSAYAFDASSGELISAFKNPSPCVMDRFGVDIAIKGDHVLVGVQPREDTCGTPGGAYLYDAQTGELLLSIFNPSPSEGELFGQKVALSEEAVVIGDYYDDTKGGTTGGIFIFDSATGSLLKTLHDPSPRWNEFYGSSVAISGKSLFVGVKGDDTFGEDSGIGYLYDISRYIE